MSKNITTFDVIMEYSRISKNKIKELRSLHVKKHRDKLSLFLVEGRKAVTDFVDSFQLENLICSPRFLSENPSFSRFGSKILLDYENIGLSQISSLSTPPEVIAVFRIPSFPVDFSKLSADRYYLLLDGIQDPGNLGTIIRTCDWFGIYDIYVSKDTVDVYNPKVIQATMGSLSRVHVHYVNLIDLIKAQQEFQLVGTLLQGTPLQKAVIKKPSLILMGNEGRGISSELRNYITLPVTIPPANSCSHPDSLNVAVATAIILSHISCNNG